MPRAIALSAAVAVGAAMLTCPPANAQEPKDEDASGATISGLSVSARIQARIAPEYEGSDKYAVDPTGALSLFRTGVDRPFHAPDEGVSLGLFGGHDWSAGLAGQWRGRRDNDHDLQGFEKVAGTVEVGGFATWWPTDGLRVRSSIRHGIGGHDGWVAEVGADVVSQVGSWTLSIGPRARWADRSFSQTYFGVTPIEAVRSPFGIKPYRARGGLAAAGVLATGEYHWNARWSIIGEGDYHRVLGAAADSPIVRTFGSADQLSFSLGVRFLFGGLDGSDRQEPTRNRVHRPEASRGTEGTRDHVRPGPAHRPGDRPEDLAEATAARQVA